MIVFRERCHANLIWLGQGLKGRHRRWNILPLSSIGEASDEEEVWGNNSERNSLQQIPFFPSPVCIPPRMGKQERFTG